MINVTTSWVGSGSGSTLIAFSGDAGGLDWYGLWVKAGSLSVNNFTIDTSGLLGGTTDEQTHAIHVDGLSGSLSDVHISYLTIAHPIDKSTSPTRRGDCIQLVGYEPQPDGSGDERLTNFEIDHINFQACARSGIGWPGGLHQSSFHDNTFYNTNDQDMDGEIGGGGSSNVEIYSNTLLVGVDTTSSIAVQIQSATSIHFHDNVIAGRGINVQTCASCEINNDSIDQTMALGGYGVIDVSKDSPGISVHDETIAREVSAGAGALVRFTQSASGAPSAVSVLDSTLTQNSSASAIIGSGIAGLYVRGTTIDYTGAPGKFAVDSLGGAGSAGIRTTDIQLSDDATTGNLLATLRISGSYAGTGTASVDGCTSNGADAIIQCENVSSGQGILGPITQDGVIKCAHSLHRGPIRRARIRYMESIVSLW